MSKKDQSHLELRSYKILAVLGGWSSEVELRAEPPVVDAVVFRSAAMKGTARKRSSLDLGLGEHDRARQAPEVVPLRRAPVNLDALAEVQRLDPPHQ